MIAERKHLTNQLALVKSAITKRSTVAVLRCVRITCHDGSVTIAATDMDIAATIPVTPIEAASNFDVLVPFAELESILKATSHDRVWIDETALPESYVMVADGGDLDEPVQAWIEPDSKLDDWPTFPVVEKVDQEVVFMASELAAALAVVLPAASKDESRPVLTGVALDVADDNVSITFASTDSYRLHKAETEGVSTGKPERRIIPARFLKLVDTYARREQREVVTLRFDQGRVEATFDQVGTVLSGRMVDGTFPDYPKLIPDNLTFLAGFDTEQLLIGLKQVKATSTRNDPAVLHVEDDGWHLSEKDGKAGIKLTKANGGPWPDPGFAIGFNPEFLQGAVKCMDDETVIFEFLAAIRPAVVSAKGSTKKLALLMPIRLAESGLGFRTKGKGVSVVGIGKADPEPESEPAAPAPKQGGVNSPTNQFLIEANVAMGKHYRVTDLKNGPERDEKELQRTYHNALVAWYLGKRKTRPLAGDLAPAKASVVKARVTRIAGKHGLQQPGN